MNRRRFIGKGTVLGSSLMLSTGHLFNIHIKEPSSTDHFWYKALNKGPYIDTQRDHKSFGFSERSIFLSTDNGRSWRYELDFWDASNITFSHIFENGNILFATQNRLYLSEDNLRTLREIVVKNRDGSDYVPHVPKSPDFPGWYYMSLNSVNSWAIDGKEMLVWGNYANVKGGGVPVNIYYSTDYGRTIKVAYTFGQNPYFTDNGSSGGQSGNLLGDPKSTVYCRHIHSVVYNPAENAFYACTGDGDREGVGHECKWLKGKYDTTADEWEWEVLIEASLNTRYKSGGINFVDGYLYFASDANGPEPYDRGIFRCRPEDLKNTEKHELLFQPNFECANMIIQDDIILAGHYAVASSWQLGIIYSPDLGKNWYEYDLEELGPRSPMRFEYKNGDGWFRADIRSGWVDRAEVLFIKPK